MDDDVASQEELGGNARQQLEGFIARIEGLLEERAEIAEKIKAEYAEAAGTGFDKKALKQIIKERAADSEKTIEHRTIVDLYRRALAKSAQGTFGDWARGWLSREAKTALDNTKGGYADPKLDEFLKGRSQRQQDAGDGEGDHA